MQPSSNNNSSMNTLLNHQQQFQMPFDPTSSHDDFLEQMLSSLNNNSSPWADLSDPSEGQPDHYNYDDIDQSQQCLMATKLRHHQINGGGGGGGGGGGLSAAAAKALMLQQQLMLARNGLRPPSANVNAHDNHHLDGSYSFKSTNPAKDNSVEALLNGYGGGSIGQGVINQFMEAQNVGGSAVAPPSGSTGAGASAQPRQPRVRARRGQATDPHSIAERLRRERIAERMKSLQELVPNANKTDKASMLDEIIEYLKFLQLQVKVLSVSRLGGAAAVKPLAADMSSQAGGDRGRRANQTQTEASCNNDNTMTVTEHQVAKLMEEDMGSAMQYLQGKGLCLMPISLATAISTATCHSRNPMIPSNLTTHRSNGGSETGGPPSPNMSALSVQSATIDNVKPEVSVKDVDC